MSKYLGHTPGPWRQNCRMVDVPGRMICDCLTPDSGEYDPEDKANACLIADAPALAENARRALKRLHYMREHTPSNLQSAEISDVIKILEGAE